MLRVGSLDLRARWVLGAAVAPDIAGFLLARLGGWWPEEADLHPLHAAVSGLQRMGAIDVYVIPEGFRSMTAEPTTAEFLSAAGFRDLVRGSSGKAMLLSPVDDFFRVIDYVPEPTLHIGPADSVDQVEEMIAAALGERRAERSDRTDVFDAIDAAIDNHQECVRRYTPIFAEVGWGVKMSDLLLGSLIVDRPLFGFVDVLEYFESRDGEDFSEANPVSLDSIMRHVRTSAG